MIPTGGADGYVRFHDPLLRIVAWFEDLGVGPIAGIAFSAAPPSKLATAELADTINRFIAPGLIMMAIVQNAFANTSSSLMLANGTLVVAPS